MSNNDSSFVLFRTKDHSYFAEVEADGLDLHFPEEVRGWSDVLDCRISPYTEKSLEENCHFAEHVRKYYILVSKEYADNVANLP